MNEVLKDIERHCDEIMDGEYTDQTHRKIELLANCVKGLAVAMQLLNERKQER